MSRTSIPARFLPLSALVKRKNSRTETVTTVYTVLPCRLSRHREVDNTEQNVRSTETQYITLFVNRTLSGVNVDLRFNDTVTIDSNIYRINDVFDVESEDHHVECELEFLRKMQTPVTT